jgi:hypothetical protein
METSNVATVLTYDLSVQLHLIPYVFFILGTVFFILIWGSFLWNKCPVLSMVR